MQKKHVLQFMFIDQTLGWYVGNYTRIAVFKNRPNNLKVYFLMSTWDLSSVHLAFDECRKIRLHTLITCTLGKCLIYLIYANLCIYRHRESERNRVSCIDFYMQKSIIHWRSTYYLGKQQKQNRVHKLLQVKRSDTNDGWEIPRPTTLGCRKRL